MASGYHLPRAVGQLPPNLRVLSELDGAKARMIAVEVGGSYWDFIS